MENDLTPHGFAAAFEELNKRKTRWTKILFLGGPSGSGKSYFAEHLASLGWRHLEIDQHSKDDINQHHLCKEWMAFLGQGDPIPLRDELLRRADRAPGIVLSFPGNLVFNHEHIRAAAGIFHIAYLFGDPAHCLASFLGRERQNERSLNADHWNHNNSDLFARLRHPANRPFLVDAFNPDGTHREAKAIYYDLFPD